MGVEILHPDLTQDLLTLFYLCPPFAAILSRALVAKIKSQRTDLPANVRTEIDHIEPIYRGGNGDEENLRALTLPEHAMRHYQEAINAKNDTDRRANHWAVGAIVRRMTPKELKEFNESLKKNH